MSIAESLSLPPAVQGVSSTDRAAWLEQRRQGVTATEVAALAKGSLVDWRRLLLEKTTGEQSFHGNQYTDHGVRREPHIAAWIEANYDIPHNDHVYARGRYLATPDGWHGLDQVIAEVKTSKHDLDPRKRGGHYTRTGYADQMQWQMFVMDAPECLFVWEQHDDAWPDPAPLGPPQAVWIPRDEARIGYLVEVADRFLADLDAARLAGSLAPVGDMPADVADLAHRLLLARNAEAVAKAQKEQTWGELQALVLDGTDHAWSNAEAKVTVSTTEAVDHVHTVDQDALLAADRGRRAAEDLATAQATADRAQAALAAAQREYDAIAADYTTTSSSTRSTQRLTVTAVRSNTERHSA